MYQLKTWVEIGRSSVTKLKLAFVVAELSNASCRRPGPASLAGTGAHRQWLPTTKPIAWPVLFRWRNQLEPVGPAPKPFGALQKPSVENYRGAVAYPSPYMTCFGPLMRPLMDNGNVLYYCYICNTSRQGTLCTFPLRSWRVDQAAARLTRWRISWT